MRRLRYRSRSFAADLVEFCRAGGPTADLTRTVGELLAAVRTRGDQAVAEFEFQFDGVRLRPGDFRVPPAALDAALRRLPRAARQALVSARRNIASFNRRNLPRDWVDLNRHGARVGEKFDPIRRVGLYVPGGQAPLVSTVFMTATLARLAGCPEIAAFTPPGRDGQIADGLLAAFRLAGVSEVYRLGGVQAIGAMAFGTRTIPAVDKIFGPGNAYVCEAKRQVFGFVGVDSLPGPSELMVIADGSARADFAAADLLAQAEHGSGRERIFLVATSARTIAAVTAEIEKQIASLPRAESIARVLADGFLAVEVDSLKQAATVANLVAPEHLQLMVRRGGARRLVRAITTAGAILMGNETPTALGDFVAGPSHVLPTGGTGRFSSGLRVADFMRRTSLLRYSRSGVRHAASAALRFAELESLEAHARSVELRCR